MDNSTILILIIFGFIILILVGIIIFFIINANNKRNLEINESISKFKDSVNSNLFKFSNNINHDFNDLTDRLNNNLSQSSKNTNEIFNSINERIVKIDEAQKNISDLSNDVISLQKILTDKKSRGTFGEVELYSLLEASYGINSDRYAKQYKLPNGSIADAAIFGGETLKIVCVDSKFPLENYRRIYDENASNAEIENARKAFKNDVKKHITDIKEKYIIPGVTAEMAYMFIPAEAIFSEIYANFDELVELSYQSKVYLVSPTTLMAYITAIKSIYLGQAKDQKAKEIEELLAQLSMEFERLNSRQDKLYKDYMNLVSDFEGLNTTSKKIINRFAKINKGELEDEQKDY